MKGSVPTIYSLEEKVKPEESSTLARSSDGDVMRQGTAAEGGSDYENELDRKTPTATGCEGGGRLPGVHGTGQIADCRNRPLLEIRRAGQAAGIGLPFEIYPQLFGERLQRRACP
jgi:hypothetical protein